MSHNPAHILPKIKVCGVTRVEDLEVLAAAGVDAVGFNFVPSSPRYVALARAQTLVARAAQLGLITVAVVRDLPLAKLTELTASLPLDFIQLHGSESPNVLPACGGLPIIKALSWSGRAEEVALADAWLASLAAPFAHSRSYSDSSPNAAAPASNSPGTRLPIGTHASPDSEVTALSRLAAFLVDAYSPDQGGGTGRVADWARLNPRPAQLVQLPIILAGGLNPANVQQAIHETRPEGVDVAGGVETAPGIKSADKCRAFASNANLAFAHQADQA